LVADAARRGAAICALFLSQRLPEMRPLLQPSFDGRFVRFSLRGPHGLMLAHESEIPGKFNERPQPVPAEFAFPPGIEARIQLTGVSVPAAAPVYGLFSVSRGWAAELGPLGSTNLSINITEADLEAVTAGKPVTYVIYFATHSENEESPSIETLKSTALPPESDPVAEASRRGQMLATFRLTKELPAVPFHELR
ncbi:MAG TPA: hypothetical protein VFW87_25265, partial [Pirellulales bacterium]|nr:hypothetical protein [Pirellulales bacterium]